MNKGALVSFLGVRAVTRKKSKQETVRSAMFLETAVDVMKSTFLGSVTSDLLYTWSIKDHRLKHRASSFRVFEGKCHKMKDTFKFRGLSVRQTEDGSVVFVSYIFF